MRGSDGVLKLEENRVFDKDLPSSLRMKEGNDGGHPCSLL